MIYHSADQNYGLSKRKYCMISCEAVYKKKTLLLLFICKILAKFAWILHGFAFLLNLMGTFSLLTDCGEYEDDETSEHGNTEANTETNKQTEL